MNFVTCVDSSPAALGVLNRAIEHGKRWNATLDVVHVYQPPASLYALDAGFYLAADELAEAERKTVWAPIEEILDESGLQWNRIDLEGHPASMICAYAEEHNSDLIVIGSRGRGDLASLVLGSTSHGVIHGTPCDVLVVHPS